jgi:glutamate dehydrogenase (NADP+)
MNDYVGGYVSGLMSDVKAKNPAEPEFHQAVQEVAERVVRVLDKHPEYRHAKIFERIIEPERFKSATYFALDPKQDTNPLWNHKAQCAFPSATQNEINGKDAANLLRNGVYLVAEGANMPTTLDGVSQFLDAKILYGPGKAANAGGVAVSGEVDDRLRLIMKSIHSACVETSQRFAVAGNYVDGANIAGFLKVADSMVDQGVV